MSSLNVSSLPVGQKVEEAIKRSIRFLPHDVAAQLEAMLSPASLAIMAAALVAWMVSHAFGVGEVADFALLAVGLGFCGWGIFDGIRDLIQFGNTAMHATSERDLDQAAQYFASAVTKIGVNALMALLFRKPIQKFTANGGLKGLNFRPSLEPVSPPPPAGVKPTVRFAPMPPADYGATTEYGDITINSNLSPAEKQLTLDHERVHSFLSPKINFLRQFRARVGISGYVRVMLLQYLEEAMAETYAQVRANGVKGVITGIKFPIKNGYLTVDDLVTQTQGAFLGVIAVEGHILHVMLAHSNHQNTSSKAQQ